MLAKDDVQEEIGANATAIDVIAAVAAEEDDDDDEDDAEAAMEAMDDEK